MFKVSFLAGPPTFGTGHLQKYERPKVRHADDWFESTAAIATRRRSSPKAVVQGPAAPVDTGCDLYVCRSISRTGAAGPHAQVIALAKETLRVQL
jgi:hypothetical protein